ncbi:hypothetical protein L596_030701 [Steinernema carpocapsae]|uniref:Uncharacterized protein n=1 Tax=Steinernema carpocapsae TaxID=34508 RepID=A0A4U5LNK3_STECR|nr:hypothetical protein L596_030701 [Steinernema carpocapsae]
MCSDKTVKKKRKNGKQKVKNKKGLKAVTVSKKSNGLHQTRFYSTKQLNHLSIIFIVEVFVGLISFRSIQPDVRIADRSCSSGISGFAHDHTDHFRDASSICGNMGSN